MVYAEDIPRETFSSQGSELKTNKDLVSRTPRPDDAASSGTAEASIQSHSKTAAILIEANSQRDWARRLIYSRSGVHGDEWSRREKPIVIRMDLGCQLRGDHEC